MNIEHVPLDKSASIAIVGMLASAPFDALVRVVKGRIDESLVAAADCRHQSETYPARAAEADGHFRHAHQLQTFLDVAQTFVHEAQTGREFSLVAIKPTP